MSRPIRILELRSVRGTGGGPEKTILFGATLSDFDCYATTVCYIRDLRDPEFRVDERARELGVDYVEVRERHSFDWTIWPVLKRLVAERGIDIIHAHDYKANFYAWLLARSQGVVPLTTLHGYTGHSWRERLYYAVDRRLVRRFPAIIAVSGQLRDEMVALGCRPSQVVRILNGIDDAAFRRDESVRDAVRQSMGVSSGDVVIGAVGRLERQKRFDLLMAAVAELRSRPGGDRLRLVIAGDGSLRDALAAQSIALGLEGVCRLLGQQADVGRLHNGFDLFVQSSDYEGTPNAVLEAMALGTPVVATDVGGTAELVADEVHGLIVPRRNVVALVAAIDRALRDPAATSNRAAAARQRVERELSFRSRVRAVEAVYDTLMSGRLRPGGVRTAVG